MMRRSIKFQKGKYVIEDIDPSIVRHFIRHQFLWDVTKYYSRAEVLLGRPIFTLNPVLAHPKIEEQYECSLSDEMRRIPFHERIPSNMRGLSGIEKVGRKALTTHGYLVITLYSSNTGEDFFERIKLLQLDIETSPFIKNEKMRNYLLRKIEKGLQSTIVLIEYIFLYANSNSLFRIEGIKKINQHQISFEDFLHCYFGDFNQNFIRENIMPFDFLKREVSIEIYRCNDQMIQEENWERLSWEEKKK